jgi:hypothetical protein
VFSGKTAGIAPRYYSLGLIHRRWKFNQNLFGQKIAHFDGKGLLVLPSRFTAYRNSDTRTRRTRMAILRAGCPILHGVNR